MCSFLHALSLKAMFLNLNEGANKCRMQSLGSCNSYVKSRIVHMFSAVRRRKKQ